MKWDPTGSYAEFIPIYFFLIKKKTSIDAKFIGPWCSIESASHGSPLHLRCSTPLHLVFFRWACPSGKMSSNSLGHRKDRHRAPWIQIFPPMDHACLHLKIRNRPIQKKTRRGTVPFVQKRYLLSRTFSKWIRFPVSGLCWYNNPNKTAEACKLIL